MVKGVGPSLEKNHFCPKSDVWVHFKAVFDRQKTRRVTLSLGTRMLRFSRETKLAKTVHKLSKNSRPDHRGAVAPSALNTPLNDSGIMSLNLQGVVGHEARFAVPGVTCLC